MFDLQNPWPLRLTGRNWPFYLVAVLALLLVVTQWDALASQGAIHWPAAWRAPFLLITDYGLSDWVLYPSLIALVLARLAVFGLRRLAKLAAYEVFLLASFVFVGVGLPGLASNLLKRAIGRGRPEVFATEGAYSFQNFFNDWTHQSFPSGHTTTAIALAFTVGFIWPRACGMLLAIGLVVAFSRVPVGMHYPTDVIGGLVVGTLGAFGVRNGFARQRRLFRQTPEGRMARQPSVLGRLYRRARR